MDVTFFEGARGRVPVRDYFATLRQRRELAPVASMERIVNLMIEKGPALGMPLTRQIDRRNGIFEARPGAHRVAFIVHEGEVVLLHAWRKRTQKLDEREAAVAVRRAKEEGRRLTDTDQEGRKGHGKQKGKVGEGILRRDAGGGPRAPGGV